MIMSSLCCKFFSASLSDFVKLSLGKGFTKELFVS